MSVASRYYVKFHPLLFQASLAAGGVALMPFNFLQFAIPHGKGLITLGAIPWSTLTPGEWALYLPLVIIMGLFTALHFALTGYFLYRLAAWLLERHDYRAFISNGEKNQNVGIFAVIGSLAMSANVVWAPLGFFVSAISSNLQALMGPSLLYFAILLFLLFFLEWKVAPTWFASGTDRAQFNFIWLLDVFAFSLVSLTGSGIAVMAQDTTISRSAASGTAVALAVGLVLLAYKLIYLVTIHVKARRLPANPILPAFFLVVPIACLFGLSAYRMVKYGADTYGLDITVSPTVLIVAGYTIAVVWGVATVLLIRDYFRSYFRTSPFAPPQWGIV